MLVVSQYVIFMKWYSLQVAFSDRTFRCDYKQNLEKQVSKTFLVVNPFRLYIFPSALDSLEQQSIY